MVFFRLCYDFYLLGYPSSCLSYLHTFPVAICFFSQNLSSVNQFYTPTPSLQSCSNSRSYTIHVHQNHSSMVSKMYKSNLVHTKNFHVGAYSQEGVKANFLFKEIVSQAVVQVLEYKQSNNLHFMANGAKNCPFTQLTGQQKGTT